MCVCFLKGKINEFLKNIGLENIYKKKKEKNSFF